MILLDFISSNLISFFFWGLFLKALCLQCQAYCFCPTLLSWDEQIHINCPLSQEQLKDPNISILLWLSNHLLLSFSRHWLQHSHIINFRRTTISQVLKSHAFPRNRVYSRRWLYSWLESRNKHCIDQSIYTNGKTILY